MGRGTDGVVAKLRHELRRAEGSREGVPAEVRRQVVELAREERAAGRTVRAVAQALGVHETTVCRWARGMAVTAPEAAARPSGFASVTLAGSASSRAEPRTAALRLVHPSGLVVEGLDVAGVAALLARLS